MTFCICPLICQIRAFRAFWRHFPRRMLFRSTIPRRRFSNVWRRRGSHGGSIAIHRAPHRSRESSTHRDCTVASRQTSRPSPTFSKTPRPAAFRTTHSSNRTCGTVTTTCTRRSRRSCMACRFDAPSSLLGGEALLASIYNAVRTSSSSNGSNYLNTFLLVTFDEAGGTYDHVAPPSAQPPDPVAPAGQMGFTFNRSGQRVPALAISAWIPERTVVNEECRHTSLIRTMRERWSLGSPLTARDATARDLSPVLSLSTPRSPDQWPNAVPRPVPKFDVALLPPNQPLSVLGKGLLPPNRLHKPHNPARVASGKPPICLRRCGQPARTGDGAKCLLMSPCGRRGCISRRTPLRRPHVFARRPGKSSKAPLRIMSVACAPVSLVSAGIVGTCAPRCFSNSSRCMPRRRRAKAAPPRPRCALQA